MLTCFRFWSERRDRESCILLRMLLLLVCIFVARCIQKWFILLSATNYQCHIAFYAPSVCERANSYRVEKISFAKLPWMYEIKFIRVELCVTHTDTEKERETAKEGKNNEKDVEFVPENHQRMAFLSVAPTSTPKNVNRWMIYSSVVEHLSTCTAGCFWRFSWLPENEWREKKMIRKNTRDVSVLSFSASAAAAAAVLQQMEIYFRIHTARVTSNDTCTYTQPKPHGTFHEIYTNTYISLS